MMGLYRVLLAWFDVRFSGYDYCLLPIFPPPSHLLLSFLLLPPRESSQVRSCPRSPEVSQSFLSLAVQSKKEKGKGREGGIRIFGPPVWKF